MPSEADKQALDAAFDDLFGRTTGYADSDHRLALTRAKKAHLLVVLDFRHVPLDNTTLILSMFTFYLDGIIQNSQDTSFGDHYA